MAGNHTFSRPVELHEDDQFRQARLFGIDRRHNALTINPSANNYVRVVTDDADPGDQTDDALRAAGADLLGPQYQYARAGFVRHALRPASHGEGRARFR